MHSGISVQEAWATLRTQIPRLFEHATFNYSGALQPGAIIQVEAMRADITTTVSFEVKDKGRIEYPGFTIGNMTARSVIYDFFRAIDPRLPPLVEYIETDTRPYLAHVPIVFELKALIPVTDHSDEPPGRLGGDNGHGQDLPPIRYGKPPINTADPKDPKVQGGLRGQLDADADSESEDSCPTDSFEDEAG
jgi:hypothetical protein